MVVCGARLSLFPLLLFAACSDGATDDPEAALGEALCRHPLLEGQRENLQIRCAELTVPEVRSDPDSPRIELPIAVLSSNLIPNEDAPLLYLTGGPGGSTAGYGQRADLAFVHSFGRPVIAFEQRGAVLANPALQCELGWLADCRDEYRARGIHTEGYNLAESARDVCSAVELLGYDQVALHGVSYGSALAQEVLRTCPDRVQAAWLDGVVEMDRPWSTELGVGFHSALERVFRMCHAREDCRAAYPDLPGVLAHLLETLPRETDLDPLDAYALSSDALIDTVFGWLYYAEIVPSLPAFLYRLDRDGLESAYEVFSLPGWSVGPRGRDVVYRGPATTFADGMHFAVSCNDDLQYVDLEAVRTAHAPLHPVMRDHFVASIAADQEECLTWDRAPRAPKSAITVDVPVLVTGGGFDPITPVAGAQRVAHQLPDAQFVQFADRAHGLADDGCATAMFLSVLSDPAKAVSTHCANSSTIQFVIDR